MSVPGPGLSEAIEILFPTYTESNIGKLISYEGKGCTVTKGTPNPGLRGEGEKQH